MEDDRRQSQEVAGNTIRKTGNKKRLLLILAVLLVGVVVIGLVFVKSSGRKNADTETPNSQATPSSQANSEATEIKDASTMNSEAAMIKMVLTVFKNGGTYNDVDITARGYYPSTADLKDASWSKENMNIDDYTHELIESGEIVYESKGCDAEKPSGEDNQCSGFVIRVDGKVAAEE